MDTKDRYEESQIYLGKTDGPHHPPVSNLHDNFTDLIFRFSGLPAHTADCPPWYQTWQLYRSEFSDIQIYLLTLPIDPPWIWVYQYQYIVFVK